MPAPPPQDSVVTPDQLCVGLFVHLDLPWFSHPFSFNSFKIRTPEQIKTLRELGVRQFRYDPERSDSQPRSNAPRTVAPPPPPSEEVSAEDEVLDAAHNAEELLSSAFGAEVIAVRDAE